MEKRWASVRVGGALVLALVAAAIATGVGTSAGSTPGLRVVLNEAIGLVFGLAASATLGLLVSACLVLKPGSDEVRRALDAAAIAAGGMTVSAAAIGLLSPGDAGWFVTAVISAAVTALCVLIRGSGAAALLALTLAALWPPASIAADGMPEGAAATALLLAVGGTLWLGALLAVVILRAAVAEPLWRTVAARLAAVAGVGALVSIASGAGWVGLAIRSDGGLTGLRLVLILVVTCLVVAGLIVLVAVARAAGVAPVRNAAGAGRGPESAGSEPASSTRPDSPGRLPVAVSLALGAIVLALGVAAASETARPPISRPVTGTTPAEILTGHPLPGPLTFWSLLSGWRPDTGWLLACALAALFYLLGVLRLHRTGRRWPIGRTVRWIVGAAATVWLTCGGPLVYGSVLFSVQLNLRLAMALAIPPLLVSAAPVALAMGALTLRSDGTRGPREWICAIGRSRPVRAAAHPLVAGVLVAGSVWLFGFGPLLRWSTTTSFGHAWASLQLLVTGLLLAAALIRRTPAAWARIPGAALVAVVCVGLGGWAALTGGLLLADWFGAMGRTWGPPPLADQRIGGTVFAITAAVLVLLLWGIPAMHTDRRSGHGSPDPSRRVPGGGRERVR